MSYLYSMAEEAYRDSKKWFPQKADNVFFNAACMAGEAGEVVNLLKKVERGTHQMDDDMRQKVAEEIADVLTYMLTLAGSMGIDLEIEYDAKREINEARFG